MILEGIVTTINPNGEVNIAAMGPEVMPDMDELVLKPFRSSQTCQNLLERPEGVFHITDDVLMLAQAALGTVAPLPAMLPAICIPGFVIEEACRACEFTVTSVDDSGERFRMEAHVLRRARLRDFFGFNRAKHAVVEAAILATRTAFLPPEMIHGEFAKLKVIVEKTGGDQEHEAFQLLVDHVDRVSREQASASMPRGGP
jgi:hypothetical protein